VEHEIQFSHSGSQVDQTNDKFIETDNSHDHALLRKRKHTDGVSASVGGVMNINVLCHSLLCNDFIISLQIVLR
jgi:hypothetical protein